MNFDQNFTSDKKEPTLNDISFSFDESYTSDNSYHPLDENDNNDDYKYPFFNLKEQINQFLTVNHELQGLLNYESLSQEEGEEEKQNEEEDFQLNAILPEKQKNQVNALQNNQQIGQMNDSKIKDPLQSNIMRNQSSTQKFPTLDQIRQKLNDYQHEINKLDYIDKLLQAEVDDKNKKKNNLPRTDFPINQQNNIKNGVILREQKSKQDQRSSKEIEFYSFKKKMEVKTKSDFQKQKKQKIHKKEKKNNETFKQLLAFQQILNCRQQSQPPASSILKQSPKQSTKLISQQTVQSRKLVLFKHLLSKMKSISFEDEIEQGSLGMKLRSKLAKDLYEIKLQTKGEKEQFRKQSQSLLYEYYKGKESKFQQIYDFHYFEKFLSDNKLALNEILPDQTNPWLQNCKKQDPFLEYDQQKMELNNKIDKAFLDQVEGLAKGKFLLLWKQQHTF